MTSATAPLSCPWSPYCIGRRQQLGRASGTLHRRPCMNDVVGTSAVDRSRRSRGSCRRTPASRVARRQRFACRSRARHAAIDPRSHAASGIEAHVTQPDAQHGAPRRPVVRRASVRRRRAVGARSSSSCHPSIERGRTSSRAPRSSASDVELPGDAVVDRDCQSSPRRSSAPSERARPVDVLASTVMPLDQQQRLAARPADVMRGSGRGTSYAQCSGRCQTGGGSARAAPASALLERRHAHAEQPHRPRRRIGAQELERDVGDDAASFVGARSIVRARVTVVQSSRRTLIAIVRPARLALARPSHSSRASRASDRLELARGRRCRRRTCVSLERDFAGAGPVSTGESSWNRARRLQVRALVRRRSARASTASSACCSSPTCRSPSAPAARRSSGPMPGMQRVGGGRRSARTPARAPARRTRAASRRPTRSWPRACSARRRPTSTMPGALLDLGDQLAQHAQRLLTPVRSR